MKLSFKPIDLARDLTEALAFRRDSFVCSFGDDARFKADDYPRWLKEKSQQDPLSVVHVWLGERLVGQMEFGKFKPDPSMGYINLYYLIPEMRGTGVSHELDAHAMAYFKKKGFARVRLCVSASNLRAIRYYSPLGWKKMGARPDDPEVEIMEKVVP